MPILEEITPATVKKAPHLLEPISTGHADRLRLLIDRMIVERNFPVSDARAIREAVLVLLKDREGWDKYVTEDTQARHKFLHDHAEEIPIESLEWIVRLSNGEEA